uniref:Uncharacterized protein n=1 Tax=Karlodinium veneficum TaxID=407301 RepID=A7WQ24_KARVE|nr:unknown [Karlodinium veneficum]
MLRCSRVQLRHTVSPSWLRRNRSFQFSPYRSVFPRNRDYSEQSDATQSDPSTVHGLSFPAKLTISLVAGSILLTFHYVILTERERQERCLRGRIDELQNENVELKKQLRDAERALFLGKK